MMKFNIPLADQFLEIIKNYEIEDWEAKCFWEIIRQSDQLDSSNVKSLREDKLSLKSKHVFFSELV